MAAQGATRRDVLTGVPLVSWQPTYVLRIPAKKLRPRYLEATGDIISAPLTSQVTSLQAEVHTLEQQLAAVPAPVPPTPADPHATEALVALLELANALKLLDAAA